MKIKITIEQDGVEYELHAESLDEAGTKLTRVYHPACKNNLSTIALAHSAQVVRHIVKNRHGGVFEG